MDFSESHTPTDAEVIAHSHLATLYNHEFGGGRFFYVVHEDENECTIQLASRTMMKIVYLKEEDDIEGIEIIKLISGQETQRIKFSRFNIAQLKEFLSLISSLNLGEISQRRISLRDGATIDPSVVRSVLSNTDTSKVILDMINEGAVSTSDIVNSAYRKKQLQVFDELLSNSKRWQDYAVEYSISTHSEEKVWQHFFEKNEWIFGYGLEYRFNGILQREFSTSNTQADGSGSVITDFLLGDNSFTTFVEIKKPSTPLFSSGINRSNSWKLSNDLIHSVSQVLEQKASGQIKLSSGNVYDTNGNRITQESFDSKVILIIGNWRTMQYHSEQEEMIKKKTFELYRRDSRNIKILTFDELYERAKFIVKHKAMNET